MDKKFLFGVVMIFGIIGFLSVISAVETINPTLPAINNTNISGTYTLNATVLGGANDVYLGNATFYYQHWSYHFNETWTRIALSNNMSENQTHFNASWDTTGVDDGIYILNVTIYDYPTNATTVNATNASMSNITIDNTAPTIVVYTGAALTTYPNGTSIKTAASLANNLTLNISVTDAGFQVNGSNTFCVVNVNGEFNHTILYSDDKWCNSSDINITGLADGNKTLYIYVNDTANAMRLNTTLVVQIDTTDPTASAICSPTTVQTGDAFPCTCTTTDVTSNINEDSSAGTSTSPDGTAVPSSTGSFTYTCNAVDNGGLTASASTTYTVGQPGGGGPGAGGAAGTGTTWVTHTITEGVFEQGHTRELSASNRVKVQVNAEDHFIGVVSMTETQATIEISSDPVQVILAAGEDAKVDVTGDGFYDVYVILNSIAGSKADVTIQKIHEEVPEGGTGVETSGELGEAEGAAATEGASLTWLWILIIVIVVLVIIGLIMKAKKQ